MDRRAVCEGRAGSSQLYLLGRSLIHRITAFHIQFLCLVRVPLRLPPHPRIWFQLLVVVGGCQARRCYVMRVCGCVWGWWYGYPSLTVFSPHPSCTVEQPKPAWSHYFLWMQFILKLVFVPSRHPSYSGGAPLDLSCRSWGWLEIWAVCWAVYCHLARDWKVGVLVVGLEPWSSDSPHQTWKRDLVLRRLGE